MPPTRFRIIFMGTPEFAVPTLKTLIAGPDQVAAVVCQPDKPKGRGRKLAAPPVKELAAANGIPVLQPEKIRGDDFLASLHSFRPDLIVVVAYGRILPERLLSMPPLGTINVHGSLLPKYRGAAPIQWALINGESTTGVTIMQMDAGMDTGDILLPAILAIDQDDTAGSLTGKLALLGAETLASALALLQAGRLPPAKQDNHLASLAPPLTKEQGLVDWTRPAREIDCLIRGLDPWPTAHTVAADTRLRLFAPRVVNDETAGKPGTLCRADGDGLLVATGEGTLLIREIQAENSRRMPVDAYLRGHRLEPGMLFG